MRYLYFPVPAPPVTRSGAQGTSRPMVEGDALLRRAHPPGPDRERGAVTPQTCGRPQPSGPGVATQGTARGGTALRPGLPRGGRGGRRMRIRAPGHPRGQRRSRWDVSQPPAAGSTRPTVLGPPGEAGGGRARLAAGRQATRRVSRSLRAFARIETVSRRFDAAELENQAERTVSLEAAARGRKARCFLQANPPLFALPHRGHDCHLVAELPGLWAHPPTTAQDRKLPCRTRAADVALTRGPGLPRRWSSASDPSDRGTPMRRSRVCSTVRECTAGRDIASPPRPSRESASRTSFASGPRWRVVRAHPQRSPMSNSTSTDGGAV